MKQTCIGFIGLGMIGGSIAKAIRRAHPDYRIMAYDRDPDTTAKAIEEHVIDVNCGQIDVAFSECDYIFLCTPVASMLRQLEILKDIINPNCILTDVGNVKCGVHGAIHGLNLDDNFIGGHPMTGAQGSGYANSNADLIRDAYYILTPAGQVGIDKISSYMELADSLGAITLLMTYEEHDMISAAIDHLPHIIAVTLVELMRQCNDSNDYMKCLGAGGFRSITRLASTRPEVWDEVCSINHVGISSMLNRYISMLVRVKVDIENRDKRSLNELFRNAKEYYETIPFTSGGPIRKEYVIYCDIENKPGQISHVTAVIADADINIKNIGIVNNREYEEGVLRIEFDDERSCAQAAWLLRNQGHTVEEIV